MELVRLVRRGGEDAVERAPVSSLARGKSWNDVLLLERHEIVRVLRPDDREVALERPNAAHEIRCKRPVATARRICALPPAFADGRHDLAGSRQELGDLPQRQACVLGTYALFVFGHHRDST